MCAFRLPPARSLLIRQASLPQYLVVMQAPYRPSGITRTPPLLDFAAAHSMALEWQRSDKRLLRGGPWGLEVEVHCPRGHFIEVVWAQELNGRVVVLPDWRAESVMRASLKGDGSDRQRYACRRHGCRFVRVARAEHVKEAYRRAITGGATRTSRHGYPIVLAGEDF